MSSFHKIDDEEIEQSVMKTKLDLITVANPINLDTLTTISTAQSNKVDFLTVTGNVDLDTISSNVTTNNNKTGITTQQSLDIQANNLKTGITNTQTSNINTNNNKVGISTSQANAIIANTAKTGITTDQTNAIVANTAKTGITTDQTNAIVANTSKNTYPSADATKLALITAGSAVNLDSIRNEINNINIQSSFLLYNHLRIGEIDTDTVCFQHKDLNGGGSVSATTSSIKIDNQGNLKLNVPTSKTFEFQVNNVKQYDNSELKNLVDNISVSQAVDLDTMESNIATNNSKVGISTTQINAINANTAKVTSNWTINGASEIHRNSNVGIKNSDPNVDLEIGDGTGHPVRIRLNGANGQAISSEIIFTDNRGGANPDFYNGASIRFNSTENRLEFMTDDGNDGTAEPAMYIHRAATPYMSTTDIKSGDLSVATCSLKPLSRYCYGKRVHSTTDTDSVITLTTGGVDLIYQNILDSGIDYNTSTGVWTVPTTGLYEIIATLNINCGSGPESVLSLFLKEGTNNILKARSHVSRAEGNNNTAMQLNMNGIVRLEASTDYNFVCASNNSGTGTIQNDLAGNNCLIIKGTVLHNLQTVPSDWNS